jgi:DNA-binding NarL/FixJ family response regulator
VSVVSCSLRHSYVSASRTVSRDACQAGRKLAAIAISTETSSQIDNPSGSNTARGSWHEKVQGIDVGADDYVAKPFQIEEVLARLRALIRRSNGRAVPELRSGGVVLDPRSARVTVNGAEVRLTSHEFRVLSYLMHHPGRRKPSAPPRRASPNSRRRCGSRSSG